MDPKSSRGKEAFNQSNTGDEIDEDNLISKAEDDERASSPNRSQTIKPLPVRKLISKIAVSQLEDSSRISENQVPSKSRNPVSNLHSNNAANPITLSISNSNLNRHPQTKNSEMNPISVGLNSNTTSTGASDLIKTNPICMEKELFPEPQSLSERNHPMEGNQQKFLEINTKDSKGIFSNCDVEMELSPTIMKDYPEHKKSSLPSWK